jgi:hypothetical protein
MHISELRDEHAAGTKGPAFESVNAAQVIFGYCTVRGNEFLLFGKGHLRRITEDAKKGERLSVLKIRLDQTEDSDDLEFAIAAIRHIRGHCDYEA